MTNEKKQILKMFQTIPGVGPSIAEDLWNLGYRKLSDLEREDPEKMYEKLCALQNTRVDRCMLYVFRCAVYFVTEKNPDSRLLQWWNWKDTP